jgi:hypothetical protein
LRTLENEIRSGMEEFYYTGMKLKEIRDDELYKEDGFDTWDKYCLARWDLSRRHCNRLILTSEYRAKIPSGPTGSQEWSERSVRELTRIEDKKDAAKVAKKIIDRLEEEDGSKLTSSFVRKVVDEELGVKRGKAKPEPEPAEDDEGDLKGLVFRHIGTVEGIYESLSENFNQDAWDWFSKKHAGLAKRLAKACDMLANYLRKVVP